MVAIIGALLGSVAGDIFGQAAGNFFGRKAAQDNRKDLLAMGLTPWEINSGGGGAQGRAGPNVLGSGSQTQQTRQLGFQAKQAQLERENRVRVAEVSARAPGEKVVLERERQPSQIGKLEQDIHLSAAKYDLVQEQVKAAKRDNKFFWPIKTAGMGPDNVLMALVLADEGVNMELALKQIKGTPEQKAAIGRAIKRVIANQSHALKTGRGLYALADELQEASGNFGRELGKRHGKWINEKIIGKRLSDKELTVGEIYRQTLGKQK